MDVKLYLRLLISAFVIFTAISELPLKAEAVFLKDGSIVTGTITADSAVSVDIRINDKTVKQIPRGSIMRILYTKLKMGKIYIQKRDGKGVVAFMVDEDQDTYTFRKELYKPEEFVLNRSQVLFISEKNPSGLQVIDKVGIDRVSLMWEPPYDAVKIYKVYIKKNDKDKYELIDSTWSKSIKLKNLKSNTNYFIIVTSVDTDDYESSPSNELKIKTKNNPPSEPVITSSGDIKSEERNVIWNPSADVDGKVEKYRIYGTKNKKREMIAEIRKTEYILKNGLNYSRVEIAAVDDSNDESDPARVELSIKDTTLGCYPGMIIPLGKMGEMYNTGYGGMFNYTGRNILINRFEAGIGIGFYYAKGKEIIKDNKPEYLNYMLVPLFINSGYRIELPYNFSFTPMLSFGGAYTRMTYIRRDSITLNEVEKTKSFIDPVVKCGLAIEYNITDSISLSLSGEYGMFVEKDGPVDFIIAGIGVGYRFYNMF